MGGPALTLGLSPTHRGYSRIETLPKHTLLPDVDDTEDRSPPKLFWLLHLRALLDLTAGSLCSLFKLSFWLLNLRILLDFLRVGGPLLNSCLDDFMLVGPLLNSCLDDFMLVGPLLNSCLDAFMLVVFSLDHIGFSIIGKRCASLPMEREDKDRRSTLLPMPFAFDMLSSLLHVAPVRGALVVSEPLCFNICDLENCPVDNFLLFDGCDEPS